MSRSARSDRRLLARKLELRRNAARRRYRPLLEILENYQVMSVSTFTVTSQLDRPAATDGDGTLRGEILAANLVGAGNSALPNNSGIDNNAGQNYPVISSVVIAQNGAHVTGTFSSTPSTTFTIEFFANATGDPSGYGQGQTYVSSISVTTDGGGNASFNNVPIGQIALGSAVSATATDNTSFNTSEFAQDAIATTTTVTAVSSSPSTSTYGQSVTFTATVTPSAGGGPSRARSPSTMAPRC
jgi:hypothetical protein